MGWGHSIRSFGPTGIDFRSRQPLTLGNHSVETSEAICVGEVRATDWAHVYVDLQSWAQAPLPEQA